MVGSAWLLPSLLQRRVWLNLNTTLGSVEGFSKYLGTSTYLLLEVGKY